MADRIREIPNSLPAQDLEPYKGEDDEDHDGQEAARRPGRSPGEEEQKDGGEVPCTIAGGRETQAPAICGRRRACSGAGEPLASTVTSPTKTPATADCASSDVSTVQTSCAAALADSASTRLSMTALPTTLRIGEDEEADDHQAPGDVADRPAASAGGQVDQPRPQGDAEDERPNESAFSHLTIFWAAAQLIRTPES